MIRGLHWCNLYGYHLYLVLDKDDCPSSSPCDNGGSCVDGIDSYTCQCTNQWLGDNCTGIDIC